MEYEQLIQKLEAMPEVRYALVYEVQESGNLTYAVQIGNNRSSQSRMGKIFVSPEIIADVDAYDSICENVHKIFMQYKTEAS